jgi:hypothetical protein
MAIATALQVVAPEHQGRQGKCRPGPQSFLGDAKQYAPKGQLLRHAAGQPANQQRGQPGGLGVDANDLIAAEQPQHEHRCADQQSADCHPHCPIGDDLTPSQFGRAPAFHHVHEEEISAQRRHHELEKPAGGTLGRAGILAAPAQPHQADLEQNDQNCDQSRENENARHGRVHQPAFPGRRACRRAESDARSLDTVTVRVSPQAHGFCPSRAWVSRGKASWYCRCAFTSGHSPAARLYITVSRTVPSRRSA